VELTLELNLKSSAPVNGGFRPTKMTSGELYSGFIPFSKMSRRGLAMGWSTGIAVAGAVKVRATVQL
jgi:hypothetical protein